DRRQEPGRQCRGVPQQRRRRRRHRRRARVLMLGVLGDLLEDIVVWLAEPLRTATDTDTTMHRTRGGSAANVAMFAAGQYPTRFLGCVGDAALGTALAADLEAHGVDVRLQRRGTTGAVIVLVDHTGERTMLPNQGASRLLEPV